MPWWTSLLNTREIFRYFSRGEAFDAPGNSNLSRPRSQDASFKFLVTSHVTLSIFFSSRGRWRVEVHQNASKLRWRTVLRSCPVLLCNLRLYISHGSESASVVAAATVVSMVQRSADYVVASSSTGELLKLNWKRIFQHFARHFSFPNWRWFHCFSWKSLWRLICLINNKCPILFFFLINHNLWLLDVF